MKLLIKNKSKWNNIFIKLLDKNHELIKKVKLFFVESVCEIDIDLNKYQYCFFSSGRNKTEVIILSENLSILELYYNNKIKKVDISFFTNECDDYGKVENFKLVDKKNLFFRKDKSKNIHVLVPPSYSKEKKYGVIIMFDAHNAYHIKKVGKYTKNHDPYEGWQVEASLANLKKIYPNQEYIVVGIQNCDIYRETELMPNSSLGNYKEEIKKNLDDISFGKIDHFIDFINETLLPFICKKYSVDESLVGICGSSCGGAASLYAGLKDYKKYKFILTFTPAIGFYEDEGLVRFFKKLDFKENRNELPFIFYYQGNKGWLEEVLAKVNENLISNLISSGYPKELIDEYFEPSAEHNEQMWRYGFAYAMYQVAKYLNK